jgi:hypothetical protein
MPKQGNKDLFSLIKSLSQSEKAYFTKFAGRHVIGKENNYLKLFNAIEKQTAYDEKKILREEKYIKQLPYLKNYLMEMILKSMQVFYAEHTKEHKLRRMVDDAWFLRKKGLFNLCNDVVTKIKKESVTTLKASSFFDAVQFEGQIVATTGNLELHTASVEKTMPDEHALLQDLLLFNEITTFHLKIYLYLRKVSPNPNDEEKAKLKKEIGAPLLVLSKKAKSFRCQMKLHHSLSVFYGLMGDNEGYYTHNKKLIALHQANPEYTRENIVQYISVLNNYGVSCKMNGKFEEALKVAKEIRSIKTSQPEEEMKILMAAVTLEINVHRISGDFDEAIKVFERNHEAMRRYCNQTEIQRYLSLYSYIVVNCIYAGKHRQGLRMITDMLSYPEINKMNWLKKLLALFQLILLYELDHDFQSFLKNTKRKMKTFGNHAAETVIMDYLEKTSKTIQEKEKKSLGLKTLDELNRLKTDISFTTLSSFFDIVSWLQSKTTSTPISEIIRSKR